MKKFLIVGNGNAVTYKEIFPLIKENKLWLGNKNFSGGMDFIAGKNYDSTKCKHPKYDEKGNIIINVMACVWFTNLDHAKRNRPLVLTKSYTPEAYPRYDNYDAIEVSKIMNIPYDYQGVMGVPVTFLDKYCPEQFEILGIQQRNDDPYKIKKYTKDEYANANDLNARGVIIIDGKPKSMYPRILIRHRK